MMVGTIIENLEVWTTAQAPKTNGRGRGASNQSLQGVNKLRELILELAVRGKLVPQDPADEPASELLKKIAKEKVRLVKEGKIKKQSLTQVEDDKKPFKVPASWKWTKLGNLSANIHYGYTASANPQLKNVRLLRITDIQNHFVNWELVPGCDISEKSIDDYKLEDGDILIARTGGTIGKSYLVNNISLCSVFASYLIRVKRLDEMYPAFIKTYLGSQLYWKQLHENSMGTGQPNVNGNALKNLLFPLPPLAEQHRIVTKVDELMALCDQLEQLQNESNVAHQTLVETLLGTLTNVENQKDFEEAWQRIANHFDVLFITEQSIDQLKQTILQLAVMGKLAPQNPNDEPASELLKKIAKEKARLVKEGKIKKQKPLPKIEEDEKPFELPENSKWVRLQTIVYLLGDGLHGTPTYTQGTKYYFINGNNLNNGKIEIKPDTKTVSAEEMLKYKKNLDSNTVLVSINGTLGNIAFYNGEEIMLGKSACYFNLSERILKSYIKVLIESPYFMDYALKNATGTTIKNLGLKAMNEFPIPLPSLAEQHRIVSKVDELFTICDALKERITESQETKVKLADALIEKAIV